MVPSDYREFFTAVAGVSGALVGLLFVAISVASDRVIGEHASVREQARAATAFTAFLLPLTIALVALLPGGQIGWVVTLFGLSAVVYVVATVRRLLTGSDRRRRVRDAIGLLGYTVVMVLDVFFGIELVLDPRRSGAVAAVAVLVVVLLLIGVERSWLLIGARDRGLSTSVRDILRGEQDEGGDPDDRGAAGRGEREG